MVIIPDKEHHDYSVSRDHLVFYNRFNQLQNEHFKF